MHYMLRKVQRNIQDAGPWIAAGKIAAQMVRPVFEMRVYRIYVIDLPTQPAPAPKLEGIAFRCLRPEEKEFIQQIEGQEEWLEGKLQDRLNGKNLCLIALEKNRVVGFNLIALDHITIPLISMERKLKPGTAWSEQISVWKSHRSLGLGVALRQHIFQELRPLGIRKLYGGTLRSNAASLALTRRAGFREISDVHFLRILCRKTRRYRRIGL